MENITTYLGILIFLIAAFLGFLIGVKIKAERFQKLLNKKLELTEAKLHTLDEKTKDLQALRDQAGELVINIESRKNSLKEVENSLRDQTQSLEDTDSKLHALMGKLDLYSRVEEFVEFGHFDMPDYLYDTSTRFTEEIRILREQQKELIRSGAAVQVDGAPIITGNSLVDKKIIDGQMRLIMRAFNTECDALVAKVSPSNFERTLARIEKIANDLEKSGANMRFGISTDYVSLKYEECRLQYQFTLKRKDEQEEQKLIREQMREESRAEKEYQNALAAAEREEALYRSLLERAREELNQSTAEERVQAEIKIQELERQLAEAEAKEQRAKSMAQQTRRGHVYVISNIGSFGGNVYKIGMTRRLDPMDRVKELGDASVPFSFDVHAIIYSDDAPSMETALHRKFSRHRVNAVNLRKEFFRVDLKKIQDAVDEIDGVDADFKTTIIADDYFETLRLRERENGVSA
tara:strand:+ start:11691 stop:13082 length:1392 start_codon:yes stop_codon:yes gene_type:complete